jgi:hypothetical protein
MIDPTIIIILLGVFLVAFTIGFIASYKPIKTSIIYNT